VNAVQVKWGRDEVAAVLALVRAAKTTASVQPAEPQPERKPQARTRPFSLPGGAAMQPREPEGAN
jgi:hypothetical protein